MKNLSLVLCFGCAFAASVMAENDVLPAKAPLVDAAADDAQPTASFSAPMPAAISTLADALAAGYVNNPSLQQKRQEVMAGHEKVAQAKSGFLPTISSQVSILGNNQRSTGSYADSGPNSPNSVRTSTRQGQVTVSQNLFAGGSTVADVLATDQSIRGAWADLLSTEQKIFLEIIKAYIDLINKTSKVDVYNANHAALKKSYETEYEKHTIGEGALTQVALAEAKLAGAEADLRTAEADVIGAKANLSAMIGVEIALVKKPADPADLPKSLDQAIMIAIENNPDVIKAQFDHKVAEANIDKVNGNFLPKVDLQASSTRQESNTHSLDASQPALSPLSGPNVRYTTNNTNNQIQLSMSYELYSGGKYSSQKRELHDTFVSKRIAIENIKTQLTGSIKSTFESYQAAKTNIDNYKRQVKAQAVALEATRQEMEVGTKVLLDVLNAQADLVKAQLGLIDAEKAYFQTAYQMVSLLGGLHAKAMKLSVNYFDPRAHYDTIRVGF